LSQLSQLKLVTTDRFKVTALTKGRPGRSSCIWPNWNDDKSTTVPESYQENLKILSVISISLFGLFFLPAQKIIPLAHRYTILFC
jgi:hypothetical protein